LGSPIRTVTVLAVTPAGWITRCRATIVPATRLVMESAEGMMTHETDTPGSVMRRTTVL
jgi:hypothetical protein